MTEVSRPQYVDNDSVPLGLSYIDEETGGVPTGTMASLIIDPTGSGELLTYHLAEANPTLYVTVSQPQEDITQNFKRIGIEDDLPEGLEVYDALNQSGDTLEAAAKQIRTRDEKVNYVIDSYSYFADSSNLYSQSRSIYRNAKKADGVTYLVFTAKDFNHLTHTEQQVVHLSDMVITTETTLDRGQINHDISIPKLRGAVQPLQERVTMTVDDGKLANEGTQTA